MVPQKVEWCDSFDVPERNIKKVALVLALPDTANDWVRKQ